MSLYPGRILEHEGQCYEEEDGKVQQQLHNVQKCPRHFYSFDNVLKLGENQMNTVHLD